MSKAIHTKDLTAYVEWNGDDLVRCWVQTPDLSRAAVMHSGPSISAKSAVANAHLFAAAAALLAACEDAYQEIGTMLHSIADKTGLHSPDEHPTMAALRAAIALSKAN